MYMYPERVVLLCDNYCCYSVCIENVFNSEAEQAIMCSKRC